MTDLYVAVSALPGIVRFDGGGLTTALTSMASTRYLEPDDARKLAQALMLHAEQAETLTTDRDGANAAVGNRHSRMILSEVSR